MDRTGVKQTKSEFFLSIYINTNTNTIVLLLTMSKGTQPSSQDHKITSHLEDTVAKFCIQARTTSPSIVLSCDDLKAEC